MPPPVITQVMIRNGVGGGPLHADPVNGAVEFDVDAECTITFKPTGVLSKPPHTFRPGAAANNTLSVIVPQGSTRYTVSYKTKKLSATMQTAVNTAALAPVDSSPNDIIVP